MERFAGKFIVIEFVEEPDLLLISVLHAVPTNDSFIDSTQQDRGIATDRTFVEVNKLIRQVKQHRSSGCLFIDQLETGVVVI